MTCVSGRLTIMFISGLVAVEKKEICILTLSAFCYKIQIMYGPINKYTGMTPQNGYSVVFVFLSQSSFCSLFFRIV